MSPTLLALAADTFCTENQDAIGQCVTGTLNHPAHTRTGSKLLNLKPSTPVDQRTEITYCDQTQPLLNDVV
ncbi:hypothetical protein BDV93DRAFT_562818 [Ceratobasidium sp. AG-I]|nr:hypothetical protein BDV93DRAFT_562818 [Ceratobasidium sp. AG-I]